MVVFFRSSFYYDHRVSRLLFFGFLFCSVSSFINFLVYPPSPDGPRTWWFLSQTSFLLDYRSNLTYKKNFEKYLIIKSADQIKKKNGVDEIKKIIPYANWTPSWCKVHDRAKCWKLINSKSGIDFDQCPTECFRNVHTAGRKDWNKPLRI